MQENESNLNLVGNNVNVSQGVYIHICELVNILGSLIDLTILKGINLKLTLGFTEFA